MITGDCGLHSIEEGRSANEKRVYRQSYMTHGSGGAPITTKGEQACVFAIWRQATKVLVIAFPIEQGTCLES